MQDTKVAPKRVRVRVDPKEVGFETTGDAPIHAEADLQKRALDAISFGASMRSDGYNIFAMGPPGVGRRTTLRTVFQRLAAKAEPFDDWVYVYNFQNPNRPRALRLPFGTALPFRDALAELIEDLANAVPAAFDSEDYKNRRDALEAGQQVEHEARLADLRNRAEAQGLALVRTPLGFAFMPARNGELVKPEVFKTWAEEDREAVETAAEALQKEVGELIRNEFPRLERKTRAEIRALDRDLARATIEVAVGETAAKFEAIDPIQVHLKQISEDIVSHFHLFLELQQAGDMIPLTAKLEHPVLRRYSVNVMDATAPDEAGAQPPPNAPIVEEPDPTYANLIGRIEYQPQQGALITDFTMIKPGALHRANGGYLILDAHDVLTTPFAWEGLKRCLKTRAIRVTSIAERVSLLSTISLEPDEVPLSAKVALIGDRRLYYLLCALDPDFASLFKVQADFEDDIERSTDTVRALSAQLAAAVTSNGLLPFHCTAVARVLEHASRLSDDAGKLSLKISAVTDLLREADHWARADAATTVRSAHVEQALDAQRRRSERLILRGIEVVDREIVLIETTGATTGQINGLAVISLGDQRFGRPSRITVRTRMGSGKIIDIEREAKLGGPLHSKGVMILSSFLATRFGGASPVSLSASIVFEQSYGGVDGDSASSAELYAMLSALAEAPIRNTLAVTGSVDQFGNVQAIGGVNEKIEGFYDVCAKRGLTGEQGVVIPTSNVQHLNLRLDVAAAVEEGRFTIHAVDHVDVGIELLTGIAAGVVGTDGRYPVETINGRVAERLSGYSEKMRTLARPSALPGAPEDEDADT